MHLTARALLIILPIVLLGMSACRKQTAGDVLARHEENYPGIRKKYVSQSLIRLANIKRDPDFEKLIKDVRKVIIYLPPPADTTYQISSLRPELRNTGYEELADFRTADAQRITLWVNESGSRPHYLALLDAQEEDLILEIDGVLNLKYLNAFNMADEGSLKNLLEIGF